MVTLKDSSGGVSWRTSYNCNPAVTTDQVLGRVVSVMDEPLQPSQKPDTTNLLGEEQGSATKSKEKLFFKIMIIS